MFWYNINIFYSVKTEGGKGAKKIKLLFYGNE